MNNDMVKENNKTDKIPSIDCRHCAAALQSLAWLRVQSIIVRNRRQRARRTLKKFTSPDWTWGPRVALD